MLVDCYNGRYSAFIETSVRCVPLIILPITHPTPRPWRHGHNRFSHHVKARRHFDAVLAVFKQTANCKLAPLAQLGQKEFLYSICIFNRDQYKVPWATWQSNFHATCYPPGGDIWDGTSTSTHSPLQLEVPSQFYVRGV